MSTLSAENIGFSYRKGKHVLEGVNLSVSSNERVAICAPSGFGKSTLCQILSGYLQPSTGCVKINGNAIQQKHGVPYEVQMIWQHPEQAVDPYLRLSKTLDEAGPIRVDLLDSLGIKPEWLDRFPHELSGGELQRFCIARALSVNPRFIIADEISTMLDAITQVQIWEYLVAYCVANQVGLIFVSHSPALTERIATRTINLEQD